MARPTAPTTHRARDPGLRLAQYGRVSWVHCPQCQGAAKSSSRGVSCVDCGYMTIQRPWGQTRWACIDLTDPRCTHCRLPLDNEPRPTARHDGDRLLVRVQCPHCRETVDYPGRVAFAPQGLPPERGLPLFLTAQVGGQTLWVDNLAHLSALESYLSALVRERGPVAGLTMMARLPAWMKSAANRPRIVRALRHLRARARKAGIDE